MNFTYGSAVARFSATSTKPSAESPSPWQMMMVALWRDSLAGDTIMVPSPCRVVVGILLLFLARLLSRCLPPRRMKKTKAP